jgi:UDP-glucose 4-epimerase
VTVLLVTGAGGTIGRRLLGALADRNVAVRVIALDIREPAEPAPGARVRWLRAPVGGPFASGDRELLAAVTHLAHLAGRMTVTVAPPDDRWTALHQPVHDLRRLVGLLPSLRHVVFASSYMVYATPPRNPVTEDRPLGPLNAYAWGKCAAEAYLADLPVASCSLRLAGVYGPGVPVDLGRSVTEVVRALIEDDPIRLCRPGTMLRNHLYIDDAVAAVCRAVTDGWSGAFNVAGPDAVSVRDAVDILASVAGRPVPAQWHDGEPGWDAVMATDLLADRYGFRPATGFRDGLRAYYQWAVAGREELAV